MMKIISAILAASLLTAEGASAKKSASKNTAPTISDIAAQTINQGSSTGTLAFTISDAQTAASSLKLSARSSNTKLVSKSKIIFGGSGANRTVTVTPTSGQSGTTTIKVTVSDGRLSASDTFVLAVNANTAPTISDIAAQTTNQETNTGAIAFAVGDTQTAASSLTVSGSSSNTTLVPNSNIVFGGSGANRTVTVTPASGQTGTATIKVTVSDGRLSAIDTFLLTVYSPPPTGFVLIPAGGFTMGNSVAEDTDITDAPSRTVTLDAFYMAKYEVTMAEWQEVWIWGLNNGYTDLAYGPGKDSNHPVCTIDWYNVVKWCNARSEKEGFTPVYYTDDAQTTIYKTNSVNVTNAQVKWTANGYRLPTEAEWEKAARGGLSSERFPWGDMISHAQANYYGHYNYYYDLAGHGTHPTYGRIYVTDKDPFTSPVGVFAANGYGLYDMAGNVREWCWDWYGVYAAGSQTKPRGSSSGTSRVVRGGHWFNYANACRVANRESVYPKGTLNSNIGLRVVRSSVR